jgi:hypothetical protein
MQDAKYFRAQAELCFSISRQLSHAPDAEKMRKQAAANLTRAEQLERRDEASASPGAEAVAPGERA